jgi:hypothetical protein
MNRDWEYTREDLTNKSLLFEKAKYQFEIRLKWADFLSLSKNRQTAINEFLVFWWDRDETAYFNSADGC